MSKFISLNEGYQTEIDDYHYEYLIQWNWFILVTHGNIYARRQIEIRDKNEITRKPIAILMHQEIIKRMKLIIPKGYTVDHKDRNGLNNKDENLRVVTYSTNNHNRNLNKNNTSGVKGVSYNSKNNYWEARLEVNGFRHNLGHHNKYEDAVEARLNAEKRYLK